MGSTPDVSTVWSDFWQFLSKYSSAQSLLLPLKEVSISPRTTLLPPRPSAGPSLDAPAHAEQERREGAGLAEGKGQE